METHEIIELLNLAIEERDWSLVEECIGHLESIIPQEDTDLNEYFSNEEDYQSLVIHTLTVPDVPN